MTHQGELLELEDEDTRKRVAELKCRLKESRMFLHQAIVNLGLTYSDFKMLKQSSKYCKLN